MMAIQNTYLLSYQSTPIFLKKVHREKPSVLKPLESCYFSGTTMKLLRFPSLVQHKIFEFKGFHSLLILSFCSKRIKYLIQSLQRYRWKDIKFVNYSFVELNEIHITVGFDIKSERIYLFPYKDLVTNPMRVFGMDPEVSYRWVLTFVLRVILVLLLK